MLLLLKFSFKDLTIRVTCSLKTCHLVDLSLFEESVVLPCSFSYVSGNLYNQIWVDVRCRLHT